MKNNKTKLLAVDDTAIAKEGMEHYFAQKGYIVFTAASTGEALPIIKKHRPQIMLLDISLPQMSAIALLKSVRQFNKALKVIITGGEVKNFSNSLKLIQFDIFAFIDKQIDFFQLESLIQEAAA